MSNVGISIGGRQFTVACAPGEEDHISSLASMIDGKLALVDGITSQSESRMLLFAALLLADEVSELREAAAKPAPAPEPAPAPAAPAPTAPQLLARLEFLSKLETLARTAENLADSLEWQAGAP